MAEKIPLILTRPEGANSAFAADFPKSLSDRLVFIESPLIGIKSIATQVALAQQTSVIFTSVNGVRFAPPSIGRRAYCVGIRTTQAATSAGWEATCVGQNADEMVKTLIEARPAEMLCHLSGVHVRGRIVERLNEAGLTARRVPLYDQLLLPLGPAARAALESHKPVIVPLFSPRAATHFAAVSPPNPRLQVVTISDAVTDAIKNNASFETVTAPEPTADAVIGCIEKLVSTKGLG
jgi:uroporphyrinogen-III synthase